MSRFEQACPQPWRALGSRLAVAVGAACALVSLLLDTPIDVAATRGALAWVAVVAHFRLSARVLGWRALQEAAERERAEEVVPASGE